MNTNVKSAITCALKNAKQRINDEQTTLIGCVKGHTLTHTRLQAFTL